MPTSEQSVVSAIKGLVEAYSVSSTDPAWDSSNSAVIAQLSKLCETAGFTVDVLPLPGDDNKANLVARLGPRTRGGLVLSGHTDTVPFDEGRWHSNPLQLTERDGALYGLGSADMKSFFALALAASEGLDPNAMTAPLYILGTADEESTMGGARNLALEDIAGAEAAVIGEPTGLKPIRLNKGIMMQAIELQGRSGHSSNPALGHNVIDALPAVLKLLDEYRIEIAQRYHCALLHVPKPTLNFGCLHGGDSPNRICGSMALHFDVRLVPGLDFSTVESELQQRIQNLSLERGIKVNMRRLIEPVDAFEEPEDSRLSKIATQVTGCGAEGVNFATEAPFLQRLGLQTLVLGPGSIDVAHQPDERLELSQIQPCIDVLKNLIQRYCLSH
ncbi:acetylornithine deacetylase [Luminiphilus syltensis NOR5-1B]|uniref:Acetylornithine deacetylase n=1 Tax=Luminiphilus syltensis NOR5-1B TaxID=565045 RepID=B8KUK4_9GAMM|nr:acetylornithine deacetylase [Luminiphilus syltensis]EED34115.1 acetylornithine deacetylase [Luminiphilus syltensis NOR5-1B]